MANTTTAAIPTVGTWKDGDSVTQMASAIDGFNMFIHSYVRLTSGSGHVSGTDWATGRMSVNTPAD